MVVFDDVVELEALLCLGSGEVQAEFALGGCGAGEWWEVVVDAEGRGVRWPWLLGEKW